MPGEYEPNDSRNVTGMSDKGMGSPGGADQQEGAPRWGGDASQQQQFDASSSGQMGQGSSASPFAAQITPHMEVIGADDTHVGTVDHVEGHRIKLTRKDSGMGSHQGHHHYISLGLVAGIEGNNVRLSANGDVAYGMEEEE